MAACRNVSVSVFNADSCQARVTAADLDGGSSDPDGQPLKSLKLSLTGEQGARYDELNLAPGSHRVTLIVENYSGNENSCESSVTVVDRTIPSITAPPDVTVPTDQGTCIATNVSLGEPVVTHGCTFTASVSNDAPAVFPLGRTIVTWVAKDDRGTGTVVTSTQTVTVTDNTPPTVTAAAPATVSADGSCRAAIPDVLSGSTASDNCTPSASLRLTQSPAAGTLVGLGLHTITVTATDAANNSSTAKTTVTINDAAPPTITAPPDFTIGSSVQYAGYPVGQCGIYIPGFRRGSPTANDNCGGVTITSNVPADNFYPVGTTTITYTATDASGNQTSATQRITVVDNLPPYAFGPGNATVSADDSCQAIVPDFIADSTIGDRQCSTSQVTATQTPAAGTRVGLGSHTITIRVEDAAGNVGTWDRTKFIVKDTTGPTITAPAAVTVYTGPGTCTAANVALGTPTTADTCSVASVTNDAPTVFLLGNTTVTWTVTDGSGNTATAAQTVTVIDNILPSVTAPAPTTASADASCLAAVPNVVSGSAASDNCTPSASIKLTQSPAAGTLVGLGQHLITVTATDLSGNSKTATTSFTVNDATPPSLTAPPAVTVMTGADATACGVFISDAALGMAAAGDNCQSVNLSRGGIPAGNLFPVGQTIITHTAKDGSGNTATATQLVTVIDNAPPMVSSSVTQSSLWPPNNHLVNVGLAVNKSDNCSANPAIQVMIYSDEDDPKGKGKSSPDAMDIAPGTLQLRSERDGSKDGRVYLIVVKATDATGNVSYACATVVVPKSQSQASKDAVNQQAADAKAYFQTNLVQPPGYFVIGDGPTQSLLLSWINEAWGSFDIGNGPVIGPKL